MKSELDTRNKQAALKLAKSLGYDTVHSHQQFRETLLKKYSLFDTDENNSGEIAIILAYNGKARLASSSEEIDMFIKATFPPCL